MKRFLKYHKISIIINICIILALILYFSFSDKYYFVTFLYMFMPFSIATVAFFNKNNDTIKINLGTTRHNLYKKHLKFLIKIIIFSSIYLLLIYLFIFIKSDFKDLLYKDFTIKYLFLLLNNTIAVNILLLFNKNTKNLILKILYLLIISINLVLFIADYSFISLIIGFVFAICSSILNYYIFMAEKI